MSNQLPETKSQFNKTFFDFLRACGAEVLTVTSKYEVARFKAHGATSILYCNKKGKLTFTGDSAEAYRAFIDGKSWQATGKNKARIIKRSPKVRTLLKRDGGNCFYCGEPLKNDITVEHLVGRAHGGPNHISNLVLAHGQCNQDAGHLSAMEKIAIRERNFYEVDGLAKMKEVKQ